MYVGKMWNFNPEVQFNFKFLILSYQNAYQKFWDTRSHFRDPGHIFQKLGHTFGTSGDPFLEFLVISRVKFHFKIKKSTNI